MKSWWSRNGAEVKFSWSLLFVALGLLKIAGLTEYWAC